jgi:hypothetical protein
MNRENGIKIMKRKNESYKEYLFIMNRDTER